MLKSCEINKSLVPGDLHENLFLSHNVSRFLKNGYLAPVTLSPNSPISAFSQEQYNHHT